MLPANTPFAVADIPLLYETGHESDFDVVVVAACEPDEQIRRVMTRDGLTEAEARSRVAAQLPIGEKISRADYVVWTTGTQDETSEKVEDVIEQVDDCRLKVAGWSDGWRGWATRNPQPTINIPYADELLVVLGGRDAFLDERVPLVALRALPEQLGAAVAAAHADVRIEIEDRVAGERQVALEQLRRTAERRKRLPDFLVNHQRVRVVAERLEEQFEAA